MNRHKLLAEILDGQGHPLGALLESWLTSKRFAAFVGDHTTKIRKKLRTATDEGSLRDLLLELDVAFRLTQDKRFSLIYEPVQQRLRGADLAVRFTTQTEFMVEVTRLKEQPRLELDASRLAGALTLKLGQFMNATPNALVIGIDGALLPNDTLSTMLATVRQRAETSDHEEFKRRGFNGRGDYLGRLDRLSVLVIYRAPRLGTPGVLAEIPKDARADAEPISHWLNPGARRPLPNRALGALLSALG